MSFSAQAIKSFLKKGEIRKLFIEGLGWDGGKSTKDCKVDDATYGLKEVAVKAGFKVWLCEMPGQKLPSREETKAVHRQLVKESYEHIIIFSSKDSKSQAWLWVRREANKPISYKHHHLNVAQDGESLTQKLRALYIAFEEEEEGVDIVDVTKRAKKAFDVEKVTKKFYQEFDKHRKVFLGFIDGIPIESDREWYASVMLNRLMFAYFIQKKGFLDSNQDYLKTKLKECQAKKGEDKFYSFYRIFLLRLFHEGLGMKKLNRPKGLEGMLGNIPYLNGGMFDVHELEQPEKYGRTIEIKDEAFEKVFAYFDQYQWHLDERPLKNDKEINPDVLGYIFEKYINQKQMGAYYTKEDITEYISKNTIIPYLFDAVRVKCGVAFDNSNGPTIWDLLRNNPDRYIYAAVRYGCDLPLPKEIDVGLDASQANLIENRQLWSKPAPAQYALPTEIWREVVARRQRYVEIRRKLAAGEVREINELITLNLDLRQFAQDVIQDCEDPALLMALWQEITTITVLDPTGGSGAFIFAALNILEPLYEACLDRMEGFLVEWGEHEKAHPNFQKKFTEVLVRVVAHPNRRYFVLKSIIVNNLFAVDIMEEAVEICKLRLFLKLASQVEPDATRDNLGIEPLPDIDFNIRAGNTLVGYATYDEVKRAITSGLDFDNAMEKIAVKAADLQQTFDKFRQLQTEGDGSVPAAQKLELQKRLKVLEDELNRHLAGEYGVKVNEKAAYAKWVKSHQPFHWFIQFYGILNGGGFDVVIGNPPWKEYSAVKKDYTVTGYVTESSGNLYALCTERSVTMLSPGGFLSFIVQLPIVSSSRMESIRDFLLRSASFVAAITCDDRPGKLFEGLQHCRSTIFLLQRRLEAGNSRLWSSGYRRWATAVREFLFPITIFAEVREEEIQQGQFPKLTSQLQVSAYSKLFALSNRLLGMATSPRATKDFVFYQESAQYWVKATVGLPHYAKNGRVGAPAHGRYLYFKEARHPQIACAILNSSLFYSFFIAYSDCFHVSDTLVTSFPVPPSALEDKTLETLGAKLMRDLERNAEKKTINTKNGDKISYDEFRVGESKPILDEIDTVLAGHYGFTAEELDFILNYDIKYRLGRSTEGDEE